MTRNSAVTVTPASGSVTIKVARIVFEPTAYDGSESSRVNLVLEASEEIKCEEAEKLFLEFLNMAFLGELRQWQLQLPSGTSFVCQPR